MLLITNGVDINFLIATAMALAGAVFGFSKYFQEETKRSKDRADADVEKHKLTVEGEVEKARERSIGAEAIGKAWAEITKIQEEIVKLQTALQTDHSNDALVNEILKRLQDDYKRLMDVFMDSFKTK